MDQESEAVAVVGAGCRLPGGVVDLAGLWTTLLDGRHVVGEIPENRFDRARFVDPGARRPGRGSSGVGGFLDDITSFDAGYFGISPREAAGIDPQQRLLLETAVEALDDAGIPAESLAGSDTCVFVGASDTTHLQFQLAIGEHVSPFTMTGGALAITANRLSYFLDLRGPSMAIDTACSSALVAIDRACQALAAGTSRTALAGGVNVLLSPAGFTGFSHAEMLSRRGRCAAFSAEADGFVRAEGAGVVVLKRLADALADGDRVHAVIAATGANCDGRTRGLAMPSSRAQEALLRAVYERAGVGPDDLVYFEAHGTGTLVGDPAEAAAVGRALGRHRERGPLPIGSVKSNLGHLEPAAGVAGLFKALLVLRHRLAPATLHATPLNPAIDFAGLGLAPTVEPVELPGTARAAVGVNSFGFGGANAHVVLTPPPPALRVPHPGHGRLPVVVSARSANALRELAARVSARLRAAPAEEFHDLAHTSTLRRAAHPHRAAVLADDPRAAAEELDRLFADEPARGARVHRANRAAVCFVYSGNGSQWPGMAADLLAAEPVFRAAVDEADAALAPHLGWSVAKELAEPDPARWRRTEVAQPALFAVQSGLTAVLRAAGVRPAVVLGHSVGEVAAAHAAGALSLEQAALVIAERGRVQGATAGGGRMAAVGLGESAARAALARHGGALELAGVNGERDVTVAGDADALAALGAELAEAGVFFRELDLDYAFHSRAMDPIAAPLRAALAGLAPTAARVPFVSTVTGSPLPGGELTGGYWWRNVREPVRFAEAVAHVLAERADILVEIGPHPVLGPYLRRTDACHVPTLRRAGDGPRELAAAVAALLAAGGEVDWSVHFPRAGRVVDLPAYPWQRERHWHGSPRDHVVRTSGSGLLDHPLLGERLPAPHPVWEGQVEPQLVPWLGDHVVGGAVLMPAAGYVEMALAAGRLAYGAAAEVRHLRILRPLPLGWPEPAGARLQTAVTPDDGTLSISASEGRGAERQPVARAQVRALLGDPPPPIDPAAARERCRRPVAAAAHYAACDRLGLGYGPAFRPLRELWSGDGEVLAGYRFEGSVAGYQAHPVVVDAALQAGLPLLDDRGPADAAFLPTGFDAVRVWRSPAASGLLLVRERSRTAQEVCWDVTVADEDGRVSIEVAGCRLRRLPGLDRAPLTVRRTVLRAAPLPGTADPAPPLPSPAELVAAAGQRIDALRGALESGGHAGFRAAALDVTARCWAAALAGLLPDPGAPFTMPELVAGGLLPQHRRLARVLLPLLARHGLATELPDGRWRLAAGPPPDTAGPLRRLLLDHPASAAEAGLLTRQLQHLPALLRGAADPAELLATERARIEQFHDVGPVSRFTHGVLRSVVAEVVRHWPADRPLRVLELGAGSGGLAAALLPVLPPERTRYTLTDASASALSRARHRLAAHDFVDHLTFDPGAEPTPGGLPAGGFDLVVAAHALRRATDLAATLRRIGRLLADGGRLLAVESDELVPLAALFGTLDAFWQRGDQALRPESPLLAGEAWPPLLERCGFDGVARVTAHAGPGGGCSVLVASGGRRATAERTGTEPAAPPRVRAGAGWLVAAETTDEEPLARELAALLDGAVVPYGGWPEPPSLALAEPSTAPPATDGPATTGGPSAVQSSVDGGPAVVLLLGEADARDDADGAVALTTRRASALRALSDRPLGDTGGAVTVCLVTRPSGLFPAPERPAQPADAAIWGVARTLANERPDLTVRRISLDRRGDPAADARRLAAELRSPDAQAEDEVVLTRGGRFVPRETERPAGEPAVPADPGRCFTLAVHDPGPGYRLAWRERARPRPGPGEILIAVRAAALNYRDTLQANGLLPAEAVESTPTAAGLGMECAGVITEVGPGVTGWAPGDRVFGLAAASLASHAVASAHAVGAIPAGMSDAAAATLPVVLGTVHHSLARQARLAPGETVLVHGGAGGIGLAVLQHAEACGARVIATAGTEAKRDLLRALGVEHVLDSRTLEFAPRVRELTGGRGVDVVVNSLSGEALARSLELLRPGGRFVELGKQDFLRNTPLALRPFLHNLAFFGVDLAALTQDPAFTGPLLAAVADGLRAGAYRPLPHTVYPAARVAEAFRLLQHSRHVGKVVVSFDPLDGPVPVAAAPAALTLDPDGSYLVTGGLGGFGAAVAEFLADRGARHLALVSRRGAAAPEAAAVLGRLAARGVVATPFAADVTDEAAMARVIAAVDGGGHRLRGVVHGAMLLRDAPLAELSDDDVRAVLAPKAAGAAVLHRLTADREVDLFLLCSSVTAAVGNLGQAPYVGGNAYLEALARARRAAGHAGTAIAWGPIAEAGFVARHELGATMAGLGFTPLPPAEALTAVEPLLAAGAAGPPVAGVGRHDWARTRRLLPLLATPRFTHLVPPGAAEAEDGRAELLRSLAAMPRDDAERAITDELAGLLATVLHADRAELSPDRRLEELGMDSLMSAEFLIRARERFDIRVSPTELIGAGRDLRHLARLVHQRLGTHPAEA